MEFGESVVDLSRLCRTCKAECSHRNSLFAIDDEDFDLRMDDMLFTCTNLKVIEGDGFPDSICDRCVVSLKAAYQFQQQCKIACEYYQQLGLKSTAPCYDYIFILKDDLAVFTCRECSQSFNTLREFKTHKVIHSKNAASEERSSNIEAIYIKKEEEDEVPVELSEEQDELISIMDTTVYMERDNEETDVLELKKENPIHDIHLKEKSLYYDKGDLDYSLNDDEHFNNSEKKKLYKCDVCEKSYSRSSILLQHKRVHGNENYKCDVCEKSYVYEQNLRAHKQTHSGKKLYKCKFCDKSYFHKRNLRDHELTHGGEKYYRCDICQKSFTRSNNLSQHKRMHTEEKPFVCNICGKSYWRRDRLRTHELTHSIKKT